MSDRNLIPRVTRLVLVLVMLVCAPAGEASADWLVTPFIGVKLAGKTNFVDLEQGAGDTKLTIGGSAGLLGEGIIGVELDFGYSPRFFNPPRRGGLVLRSNVTTVTGNVIFATPLGLTRESLRPYLVAGLGLMHADIDDVLDVFGVDRTLFAMAAGGGAIGDIGQRTSLRFDLRYFKSLSQEDTTGVGFGATRLSFWRAAAGVTFRY